MSRIRQALGSGAGLTLGLVLIPLAALGLIARIIVGSIQLGWDHGDAVWSWRRRPEAKP